MALDWSFNAPDPVGRISGTEELRRVERSTRVATGTLACPACDAPVAPGSSALTPAQPIACPYCGHIAAVRDFLSLASPTRPARVIVHVHAAKRVGLTPTASRVGRHLGQVARGTPRSRARPEAVSPLPLLTQSRSPWPGTGCV